MLFTNGKKKLNSEINRGNNGSKKTPSMNRQDNCLLFFKYD